MVSSRIVRVSSEGAIISHKHAFVIQDTCLETKRAETLQHEQEQSGYMKFNQSSQLVTDLARFEVR